MTAKERWAKLDGNRHGVLNRARLAADLTIPALMPPEGSNENTVLPTPYQSLGARGVNNLSSKLTLALFPPSTAFFRFAIDEDIIEELGEGRAAVEEGLRKMENRMMKRVEAGNLRTMLHSAIKHMIVTGNSLVYMPTDGGVRMYRLSQYCCVRDPMGRVIEIVTKESVHPTSLSDEVKQATEVSTGVDKDEPVDVYTHVQHTAKDRVEWYQEINDKRVPGSEGRAKAAESPFIVLRWTAVENEDYGRGLVEEYQGDLRSLEGLSKGIVGFSAVAAKIIFLLHPNSTTDEDSLAEAESGDIVTGRIDDIDVLQLDKYADFQVAKGVIDDLTLRLSHAFLLQSGTIRNAERVTAEEIRAQAQELEDVLGGVYTVQSQELQLPIVNRLMAQMRASGEFPALPKVDGRPAIVPKIVTGFEALGRGHELNRYRAYFSEGAALFGEAFVAQFNVERAARLLSTQHNVDVDDILKTPEEHEQEQQAQMGAQMMDKAAAPVAGAVAKSMTAGE